MSQPTPYNDALQQFDFVHMLLRKGYDGPFAIVGFDDVLTSGIIEHCMAAVDIRLQEKEATETVFYLNTELPACRRHGGRQCSLQVAYFPGQGYRITSVLLSEPGVSHFIAIASFKDLPFFRNLHTMMLSKRHWTCQLTAWIARLTSKKISP